MSVEDSRRLGNRQIALDRALSRAESLAASCRSRGDVFEVATKDILREAKKFEAYLNGDA